MNSGRAWAALPLRVVLGLGFVGAGWTALTEALSLAYGIVAWGLALGLLAGAWTRWTASLGLLVVWVPALRAAYRGETIPAGWELTIFVSGALVALVLGGGGALSVDLWLSWRRALRAKATTLIAPVRPGEVPALQQVLDEIESDQSDNPYVRFAEDRLTHFARWVLLEDPDLGTRLLYAATHNGDFESYVAEMVRVTPGLDQVWGRCEGYRGRDRFLEFAREHCERQLEPFYAFPYATVESIRTRIAVRETLERFAQLGDVQRWSQGRGLDSLLARLDRLSSPPSALARWTCRLRQMVRGVFSAIHQMILNVALWLAQAFTYLGTQRVFSKVPVPKAQPAAEQIRELEHENALEGFDNRFEQNQLTLFVDIEPRDYWRLRLALFGATFINRYGYPPGNIGGIFTIHAFHWVVIDGGRHGIFMSNYDGTMIRYIGDFVDKLVWSLDVFFNNTVGYPPGGMRQVTRFSRWLLRNQLLAQVYYCAYPQESNLAILRDTDIAEPLVRGFDFRTTERWLWNL